MSLDCATRAAVLAAMDTLAAADGGSLVTEAAQELRRLLRMEGVTLGALRQVALVGFARADAGHPSKRAFQQFLTTVTPRAPSYAPSYASSPPALR